MAQVNDQHPEDPAVARASDICEWNPFPHRPDRIPVPVRPARPAIDWTDSEDEFPIPGVCRLCRRGRFPAALAPWCERWILYEDMVGAGTRLALMRFHRGVAGIWYVVDAFRDGGSVERARLMVMGVFDRAQWGGPQPAITRAVSSLTRNKASHLLVELKPGAIRALLGVSGLAIANQRPLVAELWGAEGRELEDQLASALDHRARLRHLATALLGRLGRLRSPAGAELVAGLSWFDHQRRIQDLAVGTGYSQRQLERLFADHVGLTPKRLTALMRTGDAVQAALADARPNWAALALDCGFADQPHLTRAVADVFSLPPRRLHGLFRSRGVWCNSMMFFPQGIA